MSAPQLRECRYMFRMIFGLTPAAEPALWGLWQEVWEKFNV